MDELFEYKEYPNRYKILFIILGFLTFAIIYNYSYFFERELYLNRKRLLLYIKRNPLPSPNREGELCYEWILNSTSDSHLYLLYWKNTKNYSLHRDGECLICGFHDGYFDNKIYNELKTILETNINQFKELYEAAEN